LVWGIIYYHRKLNTLVDLEKPNLDIENELENLKNTGKFDRTTSYVNSESDDDDLELIFDYTKNLK